MKYTTTKLNKHTLRDTPFGKEYLTLCPICKQHLVLHNPELEEIIAYLSRGADNYYVYEFPTLVCEACNKRYTAIYAGGVYGMDDGILDHETAELLPVYFWVK